ncbi:TadE family type IV pilus minor pilin [Nocardioides sp. GXQ0305]|uniref:TadE family type IV pilus minor pilin n=1 Tax=Nocardioides sp. GXQ0305 TaxID=3423912 RepID=UPI003D7D8BEC
MTRRPARRWAGDQERGAVTAELALGLPLLLAVTVGLVWLLAVGAAQVRVVDGARETARMLARGDAEAAALARGTAVAGPGSRVRVAHRGDEVAVTVTRSFDGPGGVLEVLPGVRLEAEAVAVTEESP